MALTTSLADALKRLYSTGMSAPDDLIYSTGPWVTFCPKRSTEDAMTTVENERDEPNETPAAECRETWAELNARAADGDEDALNALLGTTGSPRQAMEAAKRRRAAAERERNGG